jgi:Ca2+:H+ antiporter
MRPAPLRSVSVSSVRAGRASSAVRDSDVLDETGEEEDEEIDYEANESSQQHAGVDEDVEEDEEGVDPITLKERQSLINVEHPFGLPIWKPALYKKTRSVTRYADQALHSIPSAQAQGNLLLGNILWTLVFGWWLALVCVIVSAVLYIVPRGGRRYGRLMYGLGWYLVWPFGKFVEGDIKEGAMPEDEERPRESSEHGNGLNGSVHAAGPSKRTPMMHSHSTSWVPAGEDTALLRGSAGRSTNGVIIATVKSYGATSAAVYDVDADRKTDRARDWLGKFAFWLALASIIAPLMLFVCLICWACVITIPMAKLNWTLLKYMFGRADSIRFCAPPAVVLPADAILEEDEEEEEGEEDATPTGEGTSNGVPHPTARPRTFTARVPKLAAGQMAPTPGTPTSTVLLCTYQAIGWQYYKYTVGGVNIFFVNLLPIVAFVIFDGFVLMRIAEGREERGQHVPFILAFLTDRALVFTMCLLSVIPLSYFLGMAVASISAQSSIGMGAVINATFGSIIEIILYCIALTQGKGRLVEGSIVGSLLAGVLLMPGLSMCSGAIRRKEMKFNAASAGVTSTMLIMAIIGTLTPTLFYQTYANVSISLLTPCAL